jgi:hypothetical protein
VLPGRAPGTRFGENAGPLMRGQVPAEYAPLLDELFAGMRAPGPVTQAQDVAQAVWRAVTDPAAPMHIPAGADAEALAAR